MSLKLSGREKWFVAVGGLALAVTLAWTFWAQPALDEMARLDRAMAGQIRERTQLEAVLGQYAAIKAASRGLVSQLAQREAGFNLAGYVEEQVASAGLKQRLAGLRPLPPEDASEGLKRVSVELRLNNIAFDGLVKLLYRLEYSDKLLSITSLSINANGASLDAFMRVLTLVKN